MSAMSVAVPTLARGSPMTSSSWGDGASSGLSLALTSSRDTQGSIIVCPTTTASTKATYEATSQGRNRSI